MTPLSAGRLDTRSLRPGRHPVSRAQLLGGLCVAVALVFAVRVRYPPRSGRDSGSFPTSVQRSPAAAGGRVVSAAPPGVLPTYTIADLGAFGRALATPAAPDPEPRLVDPLLFPSNPARLTLPGRGMRHPGPLATLRRVTAVNERGDIVGQRLSPCGEYHAFLSREGASTDLGTFGRGPSAATGINDAGDIVGWSATPNSGNRAFLYRNGRMIDLGTLGGDDSEAADIKARGQVVGESQTARSENHAFLYDRGRMHDLGTLGGQSSQACEINDAGQVVGSSETATGDLHAFLYDDLGMHDLGTLGGPRSHAASINEAGQAVGWAQDAGGRAAAVLFNHGRIADLNRLIPPGSGWVLSLAHAINRGGEILGVGFYRGRQHGFLLTPRRPRSYG